MGLGQRRSGPGEDRVHRTRADPGAEELFDELDSVIAGDAVADRQRRHRRFKARPERAAGHLPGQRCARAPAALRAAHSLSAMLAHHDVDRRQPFDLVARRLADRNPLARAEDVPAVTALRPVLDDLVDCRCGQQRTPVTLMAILSAAFAPRPIPCYATAPKANRSSAGARSYANSSSAHAQASRHEPPTAGHAGPSAATPRQRPHIQRQRSPPPQPDPHQGIQRGKAISPHPLNAYEKAPIYGAF